MWMLLKGQYAFLFGDLHIFISSYKSFMSSGLLCIARREFCHDRYTGGVLLNIVSKQSSVILFRSILSASEMIVIRVRNKGQVDAIEGM